MTLWCDFMSGWISGMAGIVVGHPFDTVKVRQQVNCTTVVETVKYINKHGKIMVFYRGMGAPLLTYGALNSVFFGFYGGTLHKLLDLRNHENGSRAYGDKANASYSDIFIAGCVGGVAQLTIGCPVDIIKVQLQSRLQKSLVKGPFDCIKQILQTQGFRGLYKGIGIQALRDIPSSGIYFFSYEFLKNQLTSDPTSNKLAQFLAGGLAGMISWWSILPLDVIKSRVQGDCPFQPQYRGMFQCGTVILKSEGLKGLFQGFWALSLRAFPVNGTTFLVYEYLFNHCSRFYD